MAKRNDKVQSMFKPPQSGQIIGVIVKSLGFNREVFSSKTARRYFSGQRIHDELALEILEELAFVLIDTGVFPVPVNKEGNEKYKELLSLVVQRCAIRWDQIAGYMRSASYPVNKKDLAPLPYLRLAVTDLSLRTAGILRLNGIQSITNEVPHWAEKGGNSRFLDEIMKGLGDRRPTREHIAKEIDISDNTVDSWIDAGARPSDEHLRRLADVLETSGTLTFGERAVGKLRRHYLLSTLCDSLATHVGRETTIDLATAWVRFTNGLLTLLKGYSESAALGDTLILALGTEFEHSADLLEHLWRTESDPVWRADLLAAPGDWIPRLQTTAQYLGSIDEAMEKFQKQFGVSDEMMEKMAEGIGKLVQSDPTRSSPIQPGQTRIRIKGDAAFSARNRMTQAIQASAEGDFDSAITHLRRAVELQPQSPEYHFHLGANLGKRGLIEEGIQECWIAAKLDPKWDIPLVEVGIILMNSRQNQAALDHLETVVKTLPEMTTHLAANLGYARMRCNDPKGALVMFEVVISDRPDHGLVLDRAAHCYFLTGDAKNGRAFAKRAYQLGFADTYRDWRAGKYRANSKLSGN
jgi:tetratricopeptide (TPR) repeat protein/ribosomal protein S16